MWLSVPDKSMERVGEQLTETWKSVNWTPRPASSSKFGVSISAAKAAEVGPAESGANNKQDVWLSIRVFAFGVD